MTSRPLLVLALLSILACERKPAADKGAPGFDGATAWLNVDHPLTLAELRGKVTVVDFWTSCCINCIQTLPILAAVERDYAGKPVVVVGVHSAKFDTEKDQDRLREIVSEYGVAHPVAIDGSMKLWDAWGIQAWPTVLVLDANGHVVWKGSGEPSKDVLEKAVNGALEAGRAAGALVDKPLAGLQREKDDSGPLSFPGKVLVLHDGTVAVADSGHNRVVIVASDGKVVATVGTGLAGFTDGGEGQASFHMPEGLAELDGTLYVADTGNHAVRALGLGDHVVKTVAGTGEIGTGPIAGSAPARSTKLRSPWALVAQGSTVYVALAGSHQIAALHPREGTIEAFAGDGEERRMDGAGLVASFAQPSGLSTDGTSLFVADSESSSIREVSLATRDVHTLVGQDLFVFGDVDGPAPRARLQHPLGVAWTAGTGRGALWIADTYNSKLKSLDLATGVTRTVVGGRDHALLFEPGGVAWTGTVQVNPCFMDATPGKCADALLVADTKHHRVMVVDIKSGAAHPFVIQGLTAPVSGVAVASAQEPAAAATERVVLDDVPLAATGSSKVHFDWKVPDGTGINEEAPFRVTWTSSDGLASVPTPIRESGAAVQHGFDLSVTPIPGAAGGRLEGEMSLVLCDVSTHLVCVPVRRAVEVGFRVATSAAEKAVVWIPLPAAR